MHEVRCYKARDKSGSYSSFWGVCSCGAHTNTLDNPDSLMPAIHFHHPDAVWLPHPPRLAA